MLKLLIQVNSSADAFSFSMSEREFLFKIESETFTDCDHNKMLTHIPISTFVHFFGAHLDFGIDSDIFAELIDLLSFLKHFQFDQIYAGSRVCKYQKKKKSIPMQWKKKQKKK